jgi:hypothetical protein
MMMPRVFAESDRRLAECFGFMRAGCCGPRGALSARKNEAYDKLPSNIDAAFTLPVLKYHPMP